MSHIFQIQVIRPVYGKNPVKHKSTTLHIIFESKSFPDRLLTPQFKSTKRQRCVKNVSRHHFLYHQFLSPRFLPIYFFANDYFLSWSVSLTNWSRYSLTIV